MGVRVISLLMVGCLLLIAAPVVAQTPVETLQQYLAELRQRPDDAALREKIIRHVQGMRPAPAVPAAAEKFGDRAEFAVKQAKSETDFLDAAREYGQALLHAPWVAEYYFNQGIAYERGGKLPEARQSFEFYLLAAPQAKDAREVRKRIAGLEYAVEKAAKGSGQPAAAAKKESDDERWLKKLDGVRYVWTIDLPGMSTDKRVIEIRGNVAIHKELTTWMSDEMRAMNPGRLGNWREYERSEIRGREFTQSGPPLTGHVRRCVISEDGDRITVSTDVGAPAVYYRER